MGYNISRFLRAEQLINVKIKTGMNSHVPVFDMQSYWWVWLPGIETPILEPTNISAESSGAEYTVFSFLACLWNQGVTVYLLIYRTLLITPDTLLGNFRCSNTTDTPVL